MGGGTLRMSNFKTLSTRCIKLAQKLREPKFQLSALKAEPVDVDEVQILRTATARDGRIFFIALIMLFIHK
jgi:hypothetical protein